MSCVYCFFSNEYQSKLKKMVLGNPKFEVTLNKYKNKYLDEIKKIKSLKNCNCNKNENFSDQFVRYTDEFLKDIQNNYDFIEKIFDEIITIYNCFIVKNRFAAFVRMSKYLESYSTNYTSQNAMQFTNIMFRARKKDEYKKDDINELFHIPFNKRYLSSSQRFSLAGQPMLYTGESLPLALNEIGCNEDEVNAAIYIPKYSNFYRHGMYDITNNVIDNLYATISLQEDGSIIEYNNNTFTMSKKNFKKIMADSIFYQVLTFPVQKEFSGSFIQEYVLPQLMMDIVRNRGLSGLTYQTSKQADWTELDEYKKEPNVNYCFFVPYDSKQDYNANFLNNFYYDIWSYDMELVDFNQCMSILQEYKNILKQQNKVYNMSDYKLYFCSIDRHIKKMLKCYGKKFYDSKKGKIELTLISKVVIKMKSIIENPSKYGIISWNELKRKNN